MIRACALPFSDFQGGVANVQMQVVAIQSHSHVPLRLKQTKVIFKFLC